MAHIYVVYIREAHPTDGRQSPANIREGILIEDPKTLDKRAEVANDFAEQFKVSLPILVDTIDNQVEKAYAAIPDRIYLIDAQGKIAYKGLPGPRGFQVSEVPPVLDKLLGVSLAAKANIQETVQETSAQGRPGNVVPAEMRDRITNIMRRLNIKDEDTKKILNAFDVKVQAYRAVQDARSELLRAAGRAQGDAAMPLASYREAQRMYEVLAARVDKELDSAIGYTKKPPLEAALTAMGLLGTPPGPPAAGLQGLGGRGPADKPLGRPRPPEKP